MSNAVVWFTFIVAGAVTFAQRSLFYWLPDDVAARVLPPPVQRALRYVAPAAFAAISAPRVISVSTDSAPVAAGSGESGAGLVELVTGVSEVVFDARFLAAAVASVVMWRTGRLPVMLVVGMVVFWLLRSVGL